MRKALVLGLLAALGVATAAYGATTVTNVYTMNARVTPARSGTTAHPVAIRSHFDWAVSTIPKGDRPNIVKTIDVRVQGVRENTNDFPACGTARLNDPSQGPATCPPGSKIGTGFFVAAASSPGNQSKILLTCRAELTIFNGGNHTLSYYVYKGAPVSGQPAPCPLPRSEAFIATLTSTRSGLVQSATLPRGVRHTTIGGTTFDVAAIRGSVDIPAKQTTVPVKRSTKNKKNKKATKIKVGLFESVLCPLNHQRQLRVKFTQENGRGRTLTRLVTCT